MGYSEMGRDPEPHIPVFNRYEIQVEEADFIEALFSNHDRTGWDKVGSHELDKSLRCGKNSSGIALGRCRRERRVRGALIDELPATAGQEAHVAMLFQKIELELQLVGGPQIVGVQKTDESSLGRLDAGISRGGGALILLVKAGQLAAELMEDFLRLVA